MSTTAHFPSRAILPAIGHDGVQKQGAAGLSLWLSRLASGTSGLLPVLVPPLLGYIMIVCMSPG
jgi:hypothetical protein